MTNQDYPVNFMEEQDFELGLSDPRLALFDHIGALEVLSSGSIGSDPVKVC